MKGIDVQPAMPQIATGARRVGPSKRRARRCRNDDPRPESAERLRDRGNGFWSSMLTTFSLLLGRPGGPGSGVPVDRRPSIAYGASIRIET